MPRWVVPSKEKKYTLQVKNKVDKKADNQDLLIDGVTQGSDIKDLLTLGEPDALSRQFSSAAKESSEEPIILSSCVVGAVRWRVD